MKRERKTRKSLNPILSPPLKGLLPKKHGNSEESLGLNNPHVCVIFFGDIDGRLAGKSELFPQQE